MKKHLVKLAITLVSIGWIGGVAQTARAEQFTLQDLLNGTNIVVGNTLFHGFQAFSSTGTGALAVDPSQVFVIPTMEGGKFGLIFQGNGQFAAGANQFLSAHFEFNVTGRDVNLHQANLNLTASAHAGGNGQITGTLDNGLPGMSLRAMTPITHSESNFPAGKERLHVAIDIRLSGGSGAESGSNIDSFTFSVDNPEPGTMTLLGIGTVGLLGYRWRRARKAMTA